MTIPAISRMTTSGTSFRGISPATSGAITPHRAIQNNEMNDDSTPASSVPPAAPPQ